MAVALSCGEYSNNIMDVIQFHSTARLNTIILSKKYQTRESNTKFD